MEHKELIDELRKRCGFNKQKTETLVSAVVDLIKERAPLLEHISIQGFGVFEPRKKMERISVNPANGKRTLVPPKIVLSFRPGTTIKNSLKEIPLREESHTETSKPL